MNIGLKSLAWSVVAVLMLISVATSLNGITIFLLMTPLVVLYTMLRPLPFAIHIVLIAVAAFALMGGSGAVALTFGFFFLVPSIIMGHLYKKRAAARTVITVGFLVLLAQLVTELSLFAVQYDIDFSAQLASFIEERLMQLQTSGLLTGDLTGTAASLGDAIMRMLPALLIISAFMLAFVTHALSRRMLAWTGIAVPALPKLKTWMMPRSLVWMYVIAVIITYAVSAESSGFWAVAADNAVPILKFMFTIQALAFFFYLASVKRWPNIVPILIAIPLLIFPPLYLIGFLDVAFPLRNYFVKK